MTERKTVSPFTKALSADLKSMRERAGLAQLALGEQLGQSQRWVSWVEAGRTRLDFEEVVAWCKACRTDVVSLARRMKVKSTAVKRKP